MSLSIEKACIKNDKIASLSHRHGFVLMKKVCMVVLESILKDYLCAEIL